MCCASKRESKQKISSIYNSDGELETEVENEIDIPQHADNPFLDTNVLTGVLGFRYENKDSIIVVYSNVETKIFCLRMQLKPIPN